jgi:hypothetical protein
MNPAPRRRALLPLTAAFLAGLAVAGSGLFVARDPGRARAWWLAQRYGAVPDSEGLVLTIGPAPPGAVGPGGSDGPWLVAELRNVGEHPLELLYLDPLGEQLSLTVEGPDGPLLPARGPEEPTLAGAARRLRLPPGQRVGFLVNVAERARGGPGRYVVTAEWALGVAAPGGFRRQRCLSNALRVEWPYS